MCSSWYRDALWTTKMHVWAAGVQFVTSAAIFGATNRDATAPVYTLYWRRQEGFALTREGSVPIGYYAAVFLFLSFLNHTITAWRKDWYDRVLLSECNPLRWLEYFFSAAIMHVMIAQLCGVADAYLLLCIAALTAVTMVFGWLQETLRPLLKGDGRMEFTPFLLGFVPWMVQWAVILSHFHHAGSPPKWVIALMALELALDVAFAGWMLLSQTYVDHYATVELGYVVLSLTAKQLLAWVNFGGSRSL